MDQQTVKRLIEQSAQGDHQAFRKLVEFHQTFAFSVAFRLTGNEYDSEEVVQEAFIRVWKHLPDFRSGMRFSTWLYKIVVNLSYDRLKATRRLKKYRDIHYNEAVLRNISTGENIEIELLNRDQAEIIAYLTEKLTTKQKLVFILAELEGLMVDEITSITGLSAAKIKSNLYCARREIKEKLIALENIRGNYAI